MRVHLDIRSKITTTLKEKIMSNLYKNINRNEKRYLLAIGGISHREIHLPSYLRDYASYIEVVQDVDWSLVNWEWREPCTVVMVTDQEIYNKLLDEQEALYERLLDKGLIKDNEYERMVADGLIKPRPIKTVFKFDA